jgi:hypothetical protein
MPEQKKRRPVDHKHPVIAAAIHVLKTAGGGPLSAKLIFDRAFDRGLLAATAYNTLRGRLSQHQSVAQVVVRKTSVGYMLTLEGIPEDTPERACAPSRPPPPEDPLAVIPTPRPSRRRRPLTHVRDVVVDPDWLKARKAPLEVVACVRQARWQAHWRNGEHPTVRELLTGWLTPPAAAWLIEMLPLVDEELRDRLKRAVGQSQRTAVIAMTERKKPSRRRRLSADTALAEEANDEKELNGTRKAGAR